MDYVREIIKRPGCRIIRLESGNKLTVPYALFKQKPLAAGKPLDADIYMRALAPLEEKAALEQSARMLALRDRASAEIATKLTGQGYSGQTVSAVLERLTKAGLGDDRRFAQDYTARAGKKKGSRQIRFELARKGLSGLLIEDVMRERDEGEEFTAAIRLAQKQLSKPCGDRRSLYRRAFAALARRGFAPDVVKKALETVMSQRNDAIECPEDGE